MNNKWNIIWKSYYQKATYWNIFQEEIKIAKKIERIFLLITSLIATFFYGLAIADRSCNAILNNFYVCNQDISIVVNGICILVIIFLLSILDKRLYLNLSKDNKLSQVTPSINKNRYLLFKDQLKQNNITKHSAKDCLELADIEINIVSADKFNARKTDLKFLLAFILGVISTIWKQLKIEDIIIIFLLFCMIFFLVVVILYLMPSKIEKAKELKYFISLYCLEDDIPGKSNFEYNND